MPFGQAVLDEIGGKDEIQTAVEGIGPTGDVMRCAGAGQNDAIAAMLLGAVSHQNADVARQDEVDLIKLMHMMIGYRCGIARAMLDMNILPHLAVSEIVQIRSAHSHSHPLLADLS